MNHCSSLHYTAEQRFASGVFVRSLQDAFTPRKHLAKRDSRDALYWLLEQPLEHDWPFTFRFTMDLLYQDPARVRRHLAGIDRARLRQMIEDGAAYTNPARRRGTLIELFQQDAHGQLLLFGERLAA